MQKYQKASIIVLVVCLLACLLPGCSNVGSEDWVPVYVNGEWAVALQNGKEAVCSIGIPRFIGSDTYDAEFSTQLVLYGTYTQTDGVLTITFPVVFYSRCVVRGNEKKALKEYINEDYNFVEEYYGKGVESPCKLDFWGFTYVSLDNLTMEIDISGDTWKLVSVQANYENGQLAFQKRCSEDGKSTVTAYYADGAIRQNAEYDSNENKKSELTYYENGDIRSEFEVGEKNIGYHKNGNVRYVSEFDSDGTEKSYVEYYENGNVWVQKECYEDGTEKSGVMYYENGNVRAQKEYYEDGTEKSCVEYCENGNVWVQAEYYEDGTEKSYVEYCENGNISVERECYPNGGLKKYVEYYEDGTELEYREYDQDGNVIVERP